MSLPSSNSGDEVNNSALKDDLYQLDPDEFDLPTVDHIPTLEEILNESTEDHSFLESDEAIGAEFGRFEQRSESDLSSVTGSVHRDYGDRVISDWKVPTRKACKSEILRCVKLRQVSSQLESLTSPDALDTGSVTAMCLSAVGLAVGTSRSVTFVFDTDQKLKFVLGSTENAFEVGNVSALDFSRDCSRLLVGFSRGQIQMFDMSNGKCLRSIYDAHSMGQAVVHLKFTNDRTVAICSDTGGSVFQLNFTRGFGGRGCQSKCIFSGCKGEVSVATPLVLPEYLETHVSAEPMFVAMASLTKLIVARLWPSISVVFACNLDGSPQTLPVLAWNFVPIQFTPKNRVNDPVLAFGRENQIHIYHVGALNRGESFKFNPLQRIALPPLSVLVNFCWINQRTLLVFDRSEKVHLYDVTTGEELEMLDVSHVKLIYNTCDFKGLSSGGNVSQALSYAANQACYQTICTYGGQVLMLGSASVYAITLRSWLERIDSLVRDKKVDAAIQLALDFYDGKAKLATASVNRDTGKNREFVANKLIDLLLLYVEVSLSGNCPAGGKIQVLADHYKNVIPLVINTCLKLKRMDLLFDQIYSKFAEDSLAHGYFLECLENFILDENVVEIPPVVVQSFVAHMEREGMMSTIESCVVRLAVTSLDIHQIMTVCRKHGLYDGIIYVYNNALKDFITPLKEMFPLLRKLVKKELLTDEDIKLGNRILLYTSCCLCGRAYPVGMLPADEALVISSDVYKFITSIHSDTESKDEPAYPYLRALLTFDCREFLNVLAMAFEANEFLADGGTVKCQRMIDILLQIMLGQEAYSTLHIGVLFTFICRLIVSKEDQLFVRRDQLHQLLEASLCSMEEGSFNNSSLEKQQALLELLTSPQGASMLDLKMVLKLAEKAQLYQVCEFIYWKQRKFDKLVDCYLADQTKQSYALKFVKDVICGTLMNNNDPVTESERHLVKEKFTQLLPRFVDVDSRLTAELLLEHLNVPVEQLIKQLNDQKATLLLLLTDIWDMMKARTHEELSDVSVISDTLVSLFCEISPVGVVPFLEQNESACSDANLKVCLKYEVSDAVVFLLEKLGQISEAMEYNLKGISRRLQTPGKTTDEIIDELQHFILNCVSFCKRNSDKLSKEAREAMWLSVLDCVLSSKNTTEEVKSRPDFKVLISNLVSSMMGFVDSSVLFQKLFENPVYKNGRYGDLEPLLNGVFRSYTFEEVLLDKTVSMIHRDSYGYLNQYRKFLSKPLTVHNNQCHSCHTPLNSNISGNVRWLAFSCDHNFHLTCLQELNSFSRGMRGVEWLCPVCSCASKSIEKPRKSDPSDSNGLVVEWRPNMFDWIKNKTPAIELLENLSPASQSANPFDNSGGQRDSASLFQSDQFRLRLGPPSRQH